MFTFAVERWKFDYGLSLPPDYRRYPLLDLCEEHYSILLEGPLVFPTKREVESVDFVIDLPGLLSDI